jgi:circadian clock protein KaiC
MPDSSRQTQSLERIPSGIPGLDTVLQGGFLQGGLYLVMGRPGAGKTILGNQISFNHVATGGHVLYVTLLAESHARMLAHLQSLQFYDPAPIANSLYYVSGYRVLEESGLDGLLEMLRRLIRDNRASLLVLDGLVTAESVAGSDLLFKRFIHELQVFIEVVNCTTLLLTQLDPHIPHPEHTMVDGLVELSDNRVGLRAVRELEVRKFRGSGYLRGRHIFEINDSGIVIHPRTEALLAVPTNIASEVYPKFNFGIPRMDEMLHGGVISGSTTMLLGAPGSGKTLLGLHFLAAGAERQQSGLYFGFYETPPRLIGKANKVGLDFGKSVNNGAIEVIWQPIVEDSLDVLAERLLEAVTRRQVQRLFVDGITAFVQTATYSERLGPFFTALANELRGRNVTTIFSVETRMLFSPTVEVPIEGMSAIIENIILLRYVELRSQLYRLISIMKVREDSYDATIREFKITDSGIDVAATFDSAEAILTGIARPYASSSVLSEKRPRRRQGQ